MLAVIERDAGEIDRVAVEAHAPRRGEVVHQVFGVGLGDRDAFDDAVGEDGGEAVDVAAGVVGAGDALRAVVFNAEQDEGRVEHVVEPAEPYAYLALVTVVVADGSIHLYAIADASAMRHPALIPDRADGHHETEQRGEHSYDVLGV